jgi:uncharacterized protein YprB with RNaseH-like and TPR domain
LPDKEVIERLRRMIRGLEAKKGAWSPDPVPFLSSSPSPRPTYSPDLESGSARDGSNPISRASHVFPARDYPSLRTESRQEQDYSVITTVYAEGASPELLPPSPSSLPGFRALEPSLDSLDGWAYLDIETTGLMGAATVAFLVGVGRWTAEGFSVDQYFLTSRQGEESMLAALSEALRGRRTLVTFNGKAFDVPVLQSRYVMNGMRCPLPLKAHLDFLSLTRTLGRRASYGQSLKEAVRRFTGVVREGDIPGSMIPALYFIYEREGDPSVLLPVMKHNRLDVVDMACLAWVFGHILTASAEAGDPEALTGAGKLHLRRRNLELARRCLETAGRGASDWGRVTGDGEALRLRLLARVLRRQQDWQGAIEALETLVSSAPAKDEDYLSLARCYELGPRDLSKAMETVDRALARHDGATDEIPEGLLKRKRRLERAVARRHRLTKPPGEENIGP